MIAQKPKFRRVLGLGATSTTVPTAESSGFRICGVTVACLFSLPVGAWSLLASHNLDSELGG